LFAEKAPIALHKLDQKTLYVSLKVRRHQIHAAPGSEIDGAEIEPDLLTLRTVHRTHAQRLGAIIKKTRIAEMSNQCFRQFRFQAGQFRWW
jgi:hypothetical protein